MKKIIFFQLILTIFIACKKENDKPDYLPGKLLRIKDCDVSELISVSYSSSLVTIKRHYGLMLFTSFRYSIDLDSSRIIYLLPPCGDSISYKYYSDKIIQFRYLDGSPTNEIGDTTIYFISGSGNISHAIKFYNNGKKDSIIFIWKNSNLESFQYFKDGDSHFTKVVFSYDNKQNPLFMFNVPFECLLIGDFSITLGCSQNNCIKVECFNDDVLSDSFQYSYSYFDNGLPYSQNGDVIFANLKQKRKYTFEYEHK